jgi:hypothetical protein
VIAALFVASGSATPYWSNYHVPVIHDGVPVDTPEVQHAKAAHFAALAKAKAGQPADVHHAHGHSDIKYDGKYGYASPVIVNGVPVDTPEVQHAKAAHFAKITQITGIVRDTPEVQHAKAAHFAAVAEAKARAHHHHKRSADYYHVPVIHNGVPVDTPAVQHAKAAHFAAHAAAQGHGHYDAGHYDDHHHEDIKYDGKYGYASPVIVNGVPVDTPEVQHAKAAHFAKITQITGIVQDTPEVQHAKAAHFAAVAKAQAHHGHHDHHSVSVDYDDGEWDEKKYL